jgi:hypothetical protein
MMAHIQARFEVAGFPPCKCRVQAWVSDSKSIDQPLELLEAEDV